MLESDNNSILTPTGSDKGYEYRIFKILRNVGGSNFDSLFQEHKINLRECGIDTPSEFVSLFNLREIPKTDNFIIVFPIYCKRESFPVNANNVLDTYLVHPSIVENIEAKVSTKMNGRPVFKIRNMNILDKEKEMARAYLLYDTTDKDRSSFGEQQFFNIKLSHKKLGDITEYNISTKEITSNILNIKENVKPTEKPEQFILAKTYMKFKAYDYLRRNIIDKNATKYQESICQLLSVLEFPAINLGYFGKDGEQIINTSVQNVSADIIAYLDEIDSCLLIDCTVAVPTEEKINKIVNMCSYLEGEVGTKFLPVIISGMQTLVRNTAVAANVKILDKTEINELLSRVRDADIRGARKLFIDKLKS